MLEISKLKSLLPISIDDLELRLFTEEDITERYVAWLSDPEVVKYSNQRFKVQSMASCLDYFKTFEGSNSMFVAITVKDTGQMIGTMSVHSNALHETADVGIMLGDRNFWGKGLGKTAWDILVKLLIDKGCVRKVTGGTLSCNHGMVKIMKGTGMQEDGMRRAQELVDGQAYDVVHYAKFS